VTRLRIIFILVILGLSLCAVTPPLAHPDPPHPSNHYGWETFPNGNVVLYFHENGQPDKYIYKIIRGVEPAADCTHSYGDKEFRLITSNMIYPYWYTMSIEPIMRWDVSVKRFMKLGEGGEVEEKIAKVIKKQIKPGLESLGIRNEKIVSYKKTHPNRDSSFR